MFGWLRKRRRPADQIDAVEQIVTVDETTAAEPAPELPPAPIVAAPALRPSMPLSARPNVVGAALLPDDRATPRLLDPAAALSPEAREELTNLMTDMFGARGRYRLEWRADRAAGDDAMFSEIMVADLVRRIQNSIAVVAELEQPRPFLAIEAAPSGTDDAAAHVDATAPEDGSPTQPGEASTDTDTDTDDGTSAADDGTSPSDDEPGDDPEADAGDDAPDAASDDDAHAAVTTASDAERVEAARMSAIASFFSPPETLEDIAAALQPDPDRLHDDSSEVEGDRRIA